MNRINVIEQLKIEATSYEETTGKKPRNIMISTSNYNELQRLVKYEDIKFFEINGVKLKVITSDYYDDNTLYVTR